MKFIRLASVATAMTLAAAMAACGSSREDDRQAAAPAATPRAR